MMIEVSLLMRLLMKTKHYLYA